MNGVMISNRWMSHDHMGYTLMDPSVVSWLEANVGTGHAGGGFIPGCSWLWCWSGQNYQQAVVVIEDPNKALLFKLAWGGA